MAETWYLLQCGPRAAAANMALDEALLNMAPSLGQPILRFYSWNEPAASFGYFQKFAEIARATPLRPLVRRPTGGGLVPHDADWTYSLIFQPSHPWYSLKAVQSYQRLHEGLRASFARVGTPTELSPGTPKEVPGQCFVGSEKFDLLGQGQKIAGAAQRRTRTGLLIQGSVQPGKLRTTKADWQNALCEEAQARWRVNWAAFEINADLEQIVERLAREKYSQDYYTQKR
jgi:lipoate-protein ligase A